MAGVHRIGKLEISQDLQFQGRMWKVQRVGWGVSALVLLAALLGLFGPGPLSDATASDDGLAVDYSRFGHYRAPGALHFRVPAEATAGGEVRLWLDRTYLEAIRIEGIVPEPDSVEGAENRVVYVKVDEPGRPMFVVVELTQEAIGARTARMGIVGGGPGIEFWQLTYP